MTDQQKELYDLVKSAIEEFNSKEQYLISHDLSERCICAKFGWYLERELVDTPFADYDVDVEYNRGNKGNEYDCKRLDDNQRIVVDLIVHKRGYDEQFGFNNLICIEMKKAYGKVGLDADKQRLSLMTCGRGDFCYQAGFMIVIDAEQKKKHFGLRVESSYYL